MKIKVTSNDYGYMGLPWGFEIDADSVNSLGLQCAKFNHMGRVWLLDPDEFEEQPFSPVEAKPVKQDALAVQIGGGHYKGCKIQPIEYIFANNLGYAEGNVVKYITRWKDKNGIEDLKKIIHYVELLIQEEEKKDE